MSELRKGSMRQVINTVYTKLRNDEELMRALHYPPKDNKLKQLDPLDPTLPNLIDSKEYWNIVNNTIRTASKSSNIEENAMCRIYIYPGRRRPIFGNYMKATQEIVIDVLVHDKFTSDMRLEWINDRVNELLSLELVSGVYGKLDYVAGNNRVAPIGYSLYEHIFEYLTEKK